MICLDFALGRLAVLEVRDQMATAWAVERMAEGLVRQGDPVDVEALGRHLKLALTEAGIFAEGAHARIAISDEASVTRLVTLPSMPNRHLAKAMRYVAEQELPIPLERCCWSWDWFDRDETSIRLCLSGAWQDVVDRLSAAAQAAGLVPEVVEPRSLAVARAIGLSDAFVLDSGGRELHLTHIALGQPSHVDQIQVTGGTQAWRDAAAMMLQRAFRQVTDDRRDPGLARIVLAGELVPGLIDLPLPMQSVAEVMNGHPPLRPDGLPAAQLLANLGLAMR